VGKGGVVRDLEVHRRVLYEVLFEAQKHGFRPLGLVPSPIRGKDGNLEFLLYALYAPSDDAPIGPLVEGALRKQAELTKDSFQYD